MWTIRTVNEFSYQFNLYPGFHAVGYSRGMDFFNAQVIRSNSSSIVSLLTIFNASNHNGVYVSCNEDNITLSLGDIGEYYFAFKHNINK